MNEESPFAARQKGFVGDGTSPGVSVARACDNEPIRRLNPADSTTRAVAAGAGLRSRIAVERRVIVRGPCHGIPRPRNQGLRGGGRRRGRSRHGCRGRRSRSRCGCRSRSSHRRSRRARRAASGGVPAPMTGHGPRLTSAARRPRRTPAHHRPSAPPRAVLAMAEQA
jgi:hypothetical protein